ncbi:hypothetical protein IG193_00715 [Infirmifilum lucidum]|uniref:Uncharacterized protein n=1 Tax=Infirmifilum lucidum TaxID=2776706 RepID=A0A7L9FJ23_9CREN|nr:hypothetical protein [Infirmifilum lucidum]QOJ79023.1 hypothetical protein IG193_00715 [Infirmifilum lucidum]
MEKHTHVCKCIHDEYISYAEKLLNQARGELEAVEILLSSSEQVDTRVTLRLLAEAIEKELKSYYLLYFPQVRSAINRVLSRAEHGETPCPKSPEEIKRVLRELGHKPAREILIELLDVEWEKSNLKSLTRKGLEDVTMKLEKLSSYDPRFRPCVKVYWK